MRFGNYGVIIREGAERDSGYVHLAHGHQYSITLQSYDYVRRADAEVSIDGKPVGTFRLNPAESAVLERTPGDNGRFTFYAAGTGEAAAAGESGVAVDDRGLVQVKFTPEKRTRPIPSVAIPTSRLRSASDGKPVIRGMSFGPGAKTAGITGLSGHSDQQFQTVGEIDRDEEKAVTITLRLIAVDTQPRPLIGLVKGNPVPKPI